LTGTSQTSNKTQHIAFKTTKLASNLNTSKKKKKQQLEATLHESRAIRLLEGIRCVFFVVSTLFLLDAFHLLNSSWHPYAVRSQQRVLFPFNGTIYNDARRSHSFPSNATIDFPRHIQGTVFSNALAQQCQKKVKKSLKSPTARSNRVCVPITIKPYCLGSALMDLAEGNVRPKTSRELFDYLGRELGVYLIDFGLVMPQTKKRS
jgi:hypothetical protein